MAIEKTPKNRLPKNYKPFGGVPYKVKTNDDWGSVARAHGINTQELIQFNFCTLDPAEVNWYLRENVGCRHETHDHKNYMFTSDAQPGIIYLPCLADPMNAWFGIGGTTGTMFGFVGIETCVGYVASLDDLGKGMMITASTKRLGGGAGVTGDACFIFITGVNNPQKLNGHLQGGIDFNLSLGSNWGKIAQAASKVRQLQPLINALSKLGAKTPNALKQALKAHPDKWVELSKAGRTVKDFIGIDPNGEPNVLIFAIPYAGGGLEASVFFGVSDFHAVWDNS